MKVMETGQSRLAAAATFNREALTLAELRTSTS
jgi:hypothetical protein